MLIHSPRPAITTPSNQDASLSPEHRQRLDEFGSKFSQYLPAFDVRVLKQHLLFLKATHRVFSSIDQPFVVMDEVTDRKAPVPATRLFLTKAVYRFEIWLKQVVGPRSSAPIEDHELPPLDVLIILHAYRLSPWIYDEDLNLRFPELTNIGDFPFDHIVQKLDPTTAEYRPSQEQIMTWEKATRLPFDIFAMDSIISIACPACSHTLPVPWIQDEIARQGGTGFAETGFSMNCSECHLTVDHDALATAKFVHDLIACQDAREAALAGTLSNGDGSMHLEAAREVVAGVINILGDPHLDLGKKLSWTMKTAINLIKNDPACRIRKDRVADVLRPYQQCSPFSTDLIYKAAVQGEFAARSNVKGFFETTFLQDERNTWLTDAIKSYRLFIKLVLMPHMPKVYPTYAVDLVWHTHQLGCAYKKQILDMVGVFLDHRSHDEITPAYATFEAARDAWKGLLHASGLPPLESQLSPKAVDGPDEPNACSQSASQPFAEVSILAGKSLGDDADFATSLAHLLSPADLEELLNH